VILFAVNASSFSITDSIVGNGAVIHKFQQWTKQYNKTYSSQEMPKRFSNFVASLERVQKKNQNSKNKVFGITKFSDMTPEEFKQRILMKNPITIEEERRPGVEVLKPKVTDVPSALDWRNEGAVTPVKNQEECGSCWAFSTVENVESMWILAKKGTNTTVDLSPQQVVDCDNGDDGCGGGDPPTAYQYIISTGGLDGESTYPYTAEDGTCQFKKSSVQATISNWKYATSDYDEKTLQQNLVSWGPLSVCVDAASWQDYSGGVMGGWECAWVNILDHCVELVGYDSTASTPFWIVRNSWGTDWGVSGYIMLEMWDDTCGIAHEATSSIVQKS